MTGRSVIEKFLDGFWFVTGAAGAAALIGTLWSGPWEPARPAPQPVDPARFFDLVQTGDHVITGMFEATFNGKKVTCSLYVTRHGRSLSC